MAAAGIELIRPDWPAPACVQAASTTRLGGFGSGPYASFNLGTQVGDGPRTVDKNRHALGLALGLDTEPRWLNQVHGARVVAAESLAHSASASQGLANSAASVAATGDASITSANETICAIVTADCLPVLFTDRDGQHVAAAHAGWRGLVAGILENTAAAFVARGVSPDKLLAWLGPAIGAEAYEVDAAVVNVLHEGDRAALTQTDTQHWQLDLVTLARLRLAACGVTAVYGGGFCTFTESQRFFSARRDGICGRQATLIWRQ